MVSVLIVAPEAEVESSQFAQVVERPLHCALLLMGRTVACVEQFIDPSIVSRGRHFVQDQVDASRITGSYGADN